MNGIHLQRASEFLRGTLYFEPAVVDDFVHFLSSAPEEALFRMNPIRYGREHGLEERVAIDLFLYATHAGLIEFTWGILCPYCRGFLTTPGALRALKGGRHCALCDADVQPDDDSVEVAFTVSPAVRTIRYHDPLRLEYPRDFKLLNFSPSLNLPKDIEAELARRVIHWGSLAAGESITTELDLEPGLYRLAVPAEHAWLHVTVDPAASLDRIDADLGDGQLAPWKLSVRPGRVTFRLTNRTSRRALYGVSRAIEGLRLRDVATLAPYLSGKRLVTTQSFRELFRSESIPADVGLAFKSLTVLFTDLKGSTALYERIGDLRAYALVRQHFDLLRDIIRRTGGAMVKTIGDAIMASYAEVAPAIAAAAEMNAAIARIGEGELQLKIGLHSGPAIAVELNEQLDYFGQTVNVAARVQSLANGGEIVCTDAVWKAPGVQERIGRARLRNEVDRALLKGVEGEVTVYRLRAA
ncbi:MAG: adenylate/guanylate cyclase domain-containing protein [Myxococcaceae bacterium]|nr:adenylate/guanylate cyclase domain-containing protein [Myxococcaceae bacterium]